MLKLTQKETDRLIDAGSAITDLFAKLETEREAFAGAVERIKEQIAEAQQEAWELLDDAARAAEEYHDERSEKWQEGERGQAYAEWRDRLQALAGEMEAAPEIAVPEGWDDPSWLAEISDPSEFAEFEFEG